jgi:DNA-binding NarL/FixJ family response regulator
MGLSKPLDSCTFDLENNEVNKINISIIEDEALILNSLKGLLEKQPGISVVNTASGVEGFLEQTHQEIPEIILLDIGLNSGMSGLEGIRPLKQRFPKVEIIMLTTFDDADRIFKALCAGASAYLTKRTPFVKIIEAIKTVHQGGSYMSPTIARKIVNYFAPKHSSTDVLTPRQNQIVQGIVDGLSYKMIADKLMIGTETVRDHIKKIYRKLEINSKTELIKKKMDGEI